MTDNPDLCGQCGKPAVAQAGKVRLCVDCYSKILNAYTAAENVKLQQARHAMAMANNALDEMDAMVGFSLGPRIQIPAMPLNSPVTLNNIKVDNSTVGVLNTGAVGDIDQIITALHDAGQTDAEGALKNFTEILLSNKNMKVEQKMIYLSRWPILRASSGCKVLIENPE